jgi:hypothetical protein
MHHDETVIVMGEDNVGGMGSDGERDLQSKRPNRKLPTC